MASPGESLVNKLIEGDDVSTCTESVLAVADGGSTGEVVSGRMGEQKLTWRGRQRARARVKTLVVKSASEEFLGGEAICRRPTLE